MAAKEKMITVTAEDLVHKDALCWTELEHEGKEYVFQILPDRDADNPRFMADPLWTWATTDGAGYSDKWAMSLDEFEELTREERRKYVVCKLYLYRHSGDVIGMSNTSYPFNCQWDAGCMGLAYVSREQIEKDFGWKVLTKKRKEELLKYLKYEVEEMNVWLSGGVYGFVLTDFETEQEESCWGYYAGNRWDLIDCAKDFLRDYLGSGEHIDEAVKEAVNRI
jgi:hypothetical protein